MGLAEDVTAFFDKSKQQADVDLHLAAHALEDIPEDARVEGAKLLQTPAGIAFQMRAFDILENTVLDAFGNAEVVFSFLSQYPVTAYTYELSPLVSRGERASVAKIQALSKAGFGAIINLCAETPQGDDLLVAKAGVAQRILAVHKPIVDMNAPTVAQMVDILNLVATLQAQGIRTYIHCEAGKGRTGVVVAGIRMALMGWSVDDAKTEAINFGATVPMQEAFVENFGAMLAAQYQAQQTGAVLPYPLLGNYPRLAPGSVKATPAELRANVDTAAAAGELTL